MKYYIVKYETDSMFDCVIVDEEKRIDIENQVMTLANPLVIRDINKNVIVTDKPNNISIIELYNIEKIYLKEIEHE